MVKLVRANNTTCEEFVGADGALEKGPTQTGLELPAEALLALGLDHLGQRVHEAPNVRCRVARVGQKAGDPDAAVELYADEARVYARPGAARDHDVARLGRVVEQREVEALDVHHLDALGCLENAPQVVGGVVGMAQHAHAPAAKVVDGQPAPLGEGAGAKDVYREGRTEDSAVVNVRFADGSLASMTISDATASPWNWEACAREDPQYRPFDADAYFIGGTKSALSLPRLYLMSYDGASSWHKPLKMDVPAVDPALPHKMQLKHFVRVVRGEDAPVVTPADNVKTLRALNAVKRAAETGELVEL